MKLNASARIMYEAAKARGLKVETYADKHLLKISDGEKWFFTRGSRHSKQSSVGMTIADYKSLTRQVLTKMGVLMAEGEVFFDKKSGLEYAKKVGFPLVYKPAASRHGKGVVVGVKSVDELAGLIGKKVDYRGYVLEKLLKGDDYRVLVIGNKFVAASKRLPAFVDGDGVKTIGELVEEENKNPDREEGHRGNLTKIVVDDLVLKYLEEQGKQIEDIPSEGKRVFLRKTAGLSTGGVGIDVTGEVGDENKKMFEEVSRECDLSIVGIDVMAESLSEPLSGQDNAGILELNASPGLRMHHYPYQGESRDVAGAVLDLLFEEEK